MQAIEFDTFISQNIIKIPLDLRRINNLNAKVIIQIAHSELKKVLPLIKKGANFERIKR